MIEFLTTYSFDAALSLAVSIIFVKVAAVPIPLTTMPDSPSKSKQTR